ncbi:MAG TPA: DUF1801 domain-containing protein [Flavobacteriales bacterium]|nr:DUF1801 domain-containing protein [Flavobacteriales bacterium]
MQNVKFNTVDEFLDFLPDDELKITKVLRSLILDTLPNATEYLAYNVPYYKINKSICFIWPASILWGKQKTYEGVRFGFTYGNLLRDESKYLSKQTRKQVYWHDYTRITQDDLDIIKSFLFEAAEIDREMKRPAKK